MTRDERDRAAAWFDLAERRGPVPVLDDDGIARVLRETRRIAVIGASDREPRPSFGVFRYLVARGYDCVPINPNVAAVLGVPSFPSLTAAAEATGPFDLVDVFRRPGACLEHAREAVAIGARCFWLQLGIVDWAAAQVAHDGGLEVVMDRCTAIEWRQARLGG